MKLDTPQEEDGWTMVDREATSGTVTGQGEGGNEAQSARDSR